MVAGDGHRLSAFMQHMHLAISVDSMSTDSMRVHWRHRHLTP